MTAPASSPYEAGLFSVVIPTLNEGSMLPMTTHSILSHTRWPRFEIVVVDDGSTDGSTAFYERHPNPHVRVVRSGGLGVARARNLGARHARGEFLVFLDAHCLVEPDWLHRFARMLAEPDVGVAGPSFTKLSIREPRGCGMFWADESLDQHWYLPLDGESPYAVPLTTGACQAYRHEVFDALGQYDEGCTRWGSEDVEMCLRAWLLGWRVVVDPAITVAHHFRETRGYSVDDVDITYNFLRMLHLHFSPARIRRCLQALGDNPYLVPALEKIEASDVYALRAEMQASRVFDDDWFFSQVNPAMGRAA